MPVAEQTYKTRVREEPTMANIQCMLEIYERKTRKDGRIYETKEQKII